MLLLFVLWCDARNMLLYICIRYLWTILERCWTIGAYLWNTQPLGKILSLAVLNTFNESYHLFKTSKIY